MLTNERLKGLYREKQEALAFAYESKENRKNEQKQDLAGRRTQSL